MKLCSIIILTYNGKELLAEGIPSVIEAVRYSGSDHEIMVVDNGSTDDSVEFVKTTFPGVTLIALDQNYRFVGGNNRGIKLAKHDIVVLLNNDMVVDKNFLNPLLEGFRDEGVFAVTSQIYFQDQGKRREETGKTGMHWHKGMVQMYHQTVDGVDEERKYVPIAWAGGGSAAYDKKKFMELGLFDELYLPCYVDDLDISYVAWKRGWKSLFCAESIVHHKHRATHVKQFTREELDIIILKHQILFLWKNLSSASFLLSHLFYLPLHILKQIVTEQKTMLLKAVIGALGKLPQALESRSVKRPAEIVSDGDIFKRHYLKRSYDYSDQQLKILFVCAYMPCLGAHGGGNRMFEMIKWLGLKHKVTVLTYYDDERQRQLIPELENVCSKVIAMKRGQSLREPNWFHVKPDEFIKEFANPAMKEALHNELFFNDYDIVQYEFLQMAYLVNLTQRFDTIGVFTEIEVQARKLWRDLKYVTGLEKAEVFYRWMRMLNFENQICARFDAVVALTNEDGDFVRRYNPQLDITIAPMGIDTSYFAPGSQPEEQQSLLFIGYFKHTPNVEAMIYFTESVLPKIRSKFPNVKLYIVGGDVPKEIMDLANDCNIIVTGRVEDVRPYYDKASIFIAPLRLGTGMRGKILEAWAMKKPIVTTSVGAEGYDCENGRELMIADDAESFSQSVIGLLGDEQLRARMAEEGYRKASQVYAWSGIARQYEELYYRLLKREGV